MTVQQVGINAATAGWNSGFPLDPNTSWLIVPSITSRYTINGGVTQVGFHGDGTMNGEPIGIPATVRVGGLAVLVWHHAPAGNVPQIITFAPRHDYAAVAVGPNGGSMHFTIADRAGTYGDNRGICDVRIVEVRLGFDLFGEGESSFRDDGAKRVYGDLIHAMKVAANNNDVDSATANGTAAARILRDKLNEDQAERLHQHVNNGGEPMDFDPRPQEPGPGPIVTDPSHPHR